MEDRYLISDQTGCVYKLKGEDLFFVPIDSDGTFEDKYFSRVEMDKIDKVHWGICKDAIEVLKK